MAEKKIRVIGANEHNLKNVSVDIPRDQFVVVTGLSGSGKSSLAFDTIFAEGQRRYVESLSAYARQFLGQMDKPKVELIEGLSPAVSIDQKRTSRNPRSTVGTVTEIYDYLRLLYARAGVPHCPLCGREVSRQSAQEIVDAIQSFDEGSRIILLAPIIKHRKGTHQAVLDEIQKSGFTRVRVDGVMYDLEDDIEMDRYKNHSIDAVVDRLVIRHNEEPEEQEAFLSRLTDSVETALRFGDGYLILQDVSEDPPVDHPYSEHLSCPEHGSTVPEIEPRTFSFNTPHGACPTCQGLGTKLEIDLDLLMPDKSLSLNEGAIAANEFGGPRKQGGYYWSMLAGAADAYEIDLDKPISQLTDAQMKIILYGTQGETVDIHYHHKSGREYVFNRKFEGVVNNLMRRFRETNSEGMRNYFMDFMDDRDCPDCHGARLRKEALAVTLLDKNILEITTLPVGELMDWVNLLSGDKTPLSERDQLIAQRILKELHERVGFMIDVGLEYLTLNRSAVTLSGGEAQRIRLATQIGSRLMGVLYVLDEPSIGLHPRDNQRLLNTLKGLRDIGNTVLVVEHDEETIESADFVIDMGPGAGELGGEVVVAGTVDQVLEHPSSHTAAYLSGRKYIPVPTQRREGNGNQIRIVNAHQNNLKNIDVTFPLGKIICVTGVSGSGKSSLVNDILYKSLAHSLNRAKERAGAHDQIEGTEHLDKIINIDQSPIGRTPRSNPSTYVGLFDLIRKLFSELPESKIRGYKPGRFSFNVKGGRCEACKGHGQLKIEMQFLPDVYVPCDVCHGTRFNRETLQVRFKGKNIAEILDMPIDQAVDFFSAHPRMQSKLQTLIDVGLGYIRIGQPAPTLSGGEAQRVKLAKELSKRSTGKTIYVLDEPSVGLHSADVHKLVEVLHRLVDEGNSVVIIEHNLDIIKVADHIIDLGPEGGDRGGEVIVTGTPEEVAAHKTSHTGAFLRPVLAKGKQHQA